MNKVSTIFETSASVGSAILLGTLVGIAVGVGAILIARALSKVVK